MKIKLFLLVCTGLFGIAAAADRYEAENAIVDENSVQKVADANASGGYYVAMKDGNLSFQVTVSSTGFYTLWTSYFQPNDTNGKIQNLSVNGISKGQISFPYKTSFATLKASVKINLAAPFIYAKGARYLRDHPRASAFETRMRYLFIVGP